MNSLYKKTWVRFGSAAILMFAMASTVYAQETTPEAPTPEVAPDNIQGDNATRPFLGVQIGESETGGALIVEVVPGSPADAAGLQADDVIVAIDGTAVETFDTLAEAIGSAEIGGTIALTYTRDGEETTVDVVLGTMPQTFEGDVQGSQPGRGNEGRGGNGFGGRNMPFDPQMGGMFLAQNGRLGVTFVALNAENAAEYETDATTGAIVTEVAVDSPAAQAGLQTNDVITAVNGEGVDEERTLRDRLIAYEPGDTITLSVSRTGETLDVTVTLGEPLMTNGGFFNIEEMPEGMMPEGFPFNFPPMDFPIPGDAPVQPELTPETTPNA